MGLIKRQYGKWNAVIADNGSSRLLFVVDELIFFPESLDEWIETIRHIEIAGDIYPLRMDIDISNYCNNSCVMCFSVGLRKERLNLIPLTRLIAIIKEFKERGGISVRLTGGGDCLTHPAIVETISYLDQFNLKISIQTNGDFLNKKDVQNAIARKVHSLRVSVDSFDNESRNRVHRPQNNAWTYDRLLENLSTIIKLTKKLGRENELLCGATFVVLPENYMGVKKFVDDLYSIGINWIAIRKNINRNIYKQNPHILPFVEDQLENTAEYPNLILVGQYNVSDSPFNEFNTCWASYIKPIILADSSLQLCCMSRNSLRPDAQIGLLSGEINPFQDILEREHARVSAFRTSVPKDCEICIEPSANIFVEKIRQLLARNEATRFLKANVKIGFKSGIHYDKETDIYQIALPKTQFDEFVHGRFIDISSETNLKSVM